MEKLEIFGRGVWFQAYELDEDGAKIYAESGEIDESDYDCFKDDAEGLFAGFDADATVLCDKVEIGTIRAIIESSDKEKFPKYHDALNSTLELGLRNAFVYEQGVKGLFVDAEIPDYNITDSPSQMSEFIADFLQNLEIENGGCFSLSEWNGEDLSSEIPDVNVEDAYIIYNGERYEVDVIESED